MNLTEVEHKILDHLADAWNLFCQLPNRSSSDDEEFCQAIHRLQDKIALRVARRVDVDVWRQPEFNMIERREDVEQHF